MVKGDEADGEGGMMVRLRLGSVLVGSVGLGLGLHLASLGLGWGRGWDEANGGRAFKDRCRG